MSPECQGDEWAIKTEPMLQYSTSRISNDILSFQFLNINVQYRYITAFVLYGFIVEITIHNNWYSSNVFDLRNTL